LQEKEWIRLDQRPIVMNSVEKLAIPQYSLVDIVVLVHLMKAFGMET
jgi:hypothetical protein